MEKVKLPLSHVLKLFTAISRLLAVAEFRKNGEKAVIALAQKFDNWEGAFEVYKHSTY